MDFLEQLDVFRSTNRNVIKQLAKMVVRLLFSMEIHADQERFLFTGKRLCCFLL